VRVYIRTGGSLSGLGRSIVTMVMVQAADSLLIEDPPTLQKFEEVMMPY
jgi:hypothetical protein